MRIEIVNNLGDILPCVTISHGSLWDSPFISQLSENDQEIFIPEEVSNSAVSSLHSEGAIVTIHVNAYERNRHARKACIDHYGTSCYVCKQSLESIYGSIGESYIQVHHIVPISRIKHDYIVDAIQALRPVCPNCHAMLHKQYQGEDVSIEQLQSLIACQRKKESNHNSR